MKKTIPLFYPNVTREMKDAVWTTLGDKILAQGKKVDEFENKFAKRLNLNYVLSVNSGTSALELAYHLLDLKVGDEVITPVLTFIGANVPLVRKGIKIIFTDVKDNLLMDWDDATRKITNKTKAIIQSHLFGMLNETRNLGIPVIGDSAQYLGKTTGENFTTYSFQATKLITTVDGGVLVCKDKKDYLRGKVLRWYGIDRETNKEKVDVDIPEAGYKFHMNNVTAAMGIAALNALDKLKNKRAALQKSYRENLKDSEVKVIGGSPFLVHVPNRENLMRKLSACGIETGRTLVRNDINSLFGGKRQKLPNMDRLEKTYLLLPCHNHMSLKDVEFICRKIKDNL